MLSRRDLIRRGAALTGAAAGRHLLPAVAGATGPTFDHGVASGDPTTDAVVLWTRVSGAEGDVPVRWTLARDRDLSDVVRSGDAVAAADADHTVHVDVTGLEPGTTWFYGFEAGGSRSPVGRTRTARAPDDPAEVRLGVVACSSFAAGPFTVFAHLAEADVDLVVHLGDYLYEMDTGPRRHDPPEAAVTLEDYRRRHAQQRSDPHLLRLHAALPMAAVWDDHDVADNAWLGGADGHDPDEHGPWEERRAAALRAWLEWLPVRLPDPSQPERIWRQLPLGGVGDLLLLDTRHDGRDQQVSTSGDEGAAQLDAEERRLISDEQRTWLAGALAASTTTWRVLGNQVVLTPLAFEVPDLLSSSTSALGLTVGGRVVNPDAWDGYPAERRRVLREVAAAGPTVVLTGDVHSSWAFEIADADGDPLTVEWVVPSTTATPFADIVGLPAPSLAPAAVDLIAGQLPQLRWADITEHGFLVVALTEERAQADWWHVDLVEGGAEVAASWSVPTTASRLAEASPLAAREAPAPPAPVPPSPPGTIATLPGEPGIGADRPPPAAVAGAAALVAAAAGAVALRTRRRR